MPELTRGTMVDLAGAPSEDPSASASVNAAVEDQSAADRVHLAPQVGAYNPARDLGLP